jgi:hypothetical protein
VTKRTSRLSSAPRTRRRRPAQRPARRLHAPHEHLVEHVSGRDGRACSRRSAEPSSAPNGPPDRCAAPPLAAKRAWRGCASSAASGLRGSLSARNAFSAS